MLPAPFHQTLLQAGLDLVCAFDAARYNERIQDRPSLPPLPLFEREGALAVLIGNSRALWPHFVQSAQSSPALAAADHPLDRYVTEAISAAAAHLPWRKELRFSHDAGTRFVSMLDAAAASGLADVGPAFLAVHPEHGPWFALRSVLVLDEAPPVALTAPRPSPCDGCAAPCAVALEEAFADKRIERSWQRWVAVRDACPVGRASRYGEAQLLYHYTKDRGALMLDAAGADSEG